MTEPTVNYFVSYLIKLADGENRGALASLRRGLGLRPGEAPEMFPYVVPFLPAHCSHDQEQVYYLIGSLFAYHPKNIIEGNMGDHLAACIQGGNDREALERRFVALLNCHIDDMGDLLRQSVSFLKSKEQPINYSQLFSDLMNWSHRDRIVQRRWAYGFWGQTAENKSNLSAQ